ncbi:DUF4279 domain-containing protein [bacterium]|nr:MAG: DUF4279 domain-containing protein [bacterium]
MPDPVRRPKYKIKENFWLLESALPETERPEVHLQNLLSILEPHEAEIAKLSAKYPTQVGYYYWCRDWSPGIWFEADEVKRISRLGSTIDIDLYVSPDDEDAPIRRNSLHERSEKSLTGH